MDIERIHDVIPEAKVFFEKSLPSTNDTLRQMAKDGAADGTVLIAEEQSAGRGRMERSFFSPKETGLYLSVLYRRPMNVRRALYLTTAAAVAVAQSVEALTGQRADIKWVNDVYLHGRKICGILTEGAILPGTDQLAWAVVGVGINLFPPRENFPADIERKAGSAFSKEDFLRCDSIKDQFMVDFLRRLFSFFDALVEKPFLSEYRRRLMFLGKEIQVFRGETCFEATAIEVDDEFRLLVRDKNGKRISLESGEISVREKEGE